MAKPSSQSRAPAPSEEQRTLIMKATWEISDLATGLLNLDGDCEGMVRAAAVRLEGLSSLIGTLMEGADPSDQLKALGGIVR